MSWNKKTLSFDTHQWYRVYKKTRTFTPEEQAEFDKKWEEKKEKERQARWKRNYEKLGCKADWLDRTFKHKDGTIFILKDIRPRKQKPFDGYLQYPEGDTRKSGSYFLAPFYFKQFKVIAKENTGGKSNGK